MQYSYSPFRHSRWEKNPLLHLCHKGNPPGLEFWKQKTGVWILVFPSTKSAHFFSLFYTEKTRHVFWILRQLMTSKVGRDRSWAHVPPLPEKVIITGSLHVYAIFCWFCFNLTTRNSNVWFFLPLSRQTSAVEAGTCLLCAQCLEQCRMQSRPSV